MFLLLKKIKKHLQKSIKIELIMINKLRIR